MTTLTDEQRALLDDWVQLGASWHADSAQAIRAALATIDAQHKEISALEAESARLAKYVLNSGHRAPDYACSACVPGGRINVPGFVCTWHAALARIDTLHKEGEP